MVTTFKGTKQVFILKLANYQITWYLIIWNQERIIKTIKCFNKKRRRSIFIHKSKINSAFTITLKIKIISWFLLKYWNSDCTFPFFRLHFKCSLYKPVIVKHSSLSKSLKSMNLSILLLCYLVSIWIFQTSLCIETVSEIALISLMMSLFK